MKVFNSILIGNNILSGSLGGLYARFSGSFSGSFQGDGSDLYNLVSSSYAISASYAPYQVSASYANSSSYVHWNNIGSKPSNIVSSSQQIASDISGAIAGVTNISASDGLVSVGNNVYLGDSSEGLNNPGRLLSTRYINLSGSDFIFAGLNDNTSSLVKIQSDGTIVGDYSSSYNVNRYQEIFKFRPLQQDQGNTDFVFAMGTTVSPGDLARNNDTMMYGWNVGGGGSPIESGKAMVAWAFENGYNPTASLRYQEVHLLHTDIYGTARRPITIFLNEADTSSWSIAFHTPRFDVKEADTQEPYFQVRNEISNGDVYVKLQDSFTTVGSSISVSPLQNALTIGNIGMTDPTLYMQQYFSTVVNKLQIRSNESTPNQLIGRNTAADGWVGEVQTGSLFVIESGVLKFNSNVGIISSSQQIASDISGAFYSTSQSFSTSLDLKAPISSPVFTGTVTLPSTNLNGDLQMAENVGIIFDSSLSTDGKYSGITETGIAAETLSFGDLIYLGGHGRWALTNAVSASLSGGVKIGVCLLNAASNGSSTNVLLYGKVRADARFPTLVTGSAVYAGLSSGSIQTWQPSGSDQVIRIVGFANTADELFFTPSQDYITHI